MCALVAVVVSCTATAQPQTRSASGGYARVAKMQDVLGLRLARSVAARRIVLGAPRTDESQAMAKAGAMRDKREPARIGFVRAPDEWQRHIALAALSWQRSDDGGLAARVEVTSETAHGVRVLLRFEGIDGSLEARFAGVAGRGQAFAATASELARPGGYWSPVLEGETGVVELHVAAGASVAGTMTIDGVGHLVAAGAELKLLGDIGTSGYCERDVACTANPSTALINVARSVVQTVLVVDRFIVVCSATLLVTKPRSDIPYVMGAYHCYDPGRVRTEEQVQAVAASMSVYWFFDATRCGNATPGDYVQTTDGSTLMFRSPDIDFVLVRLNSAPPANAYYSGWQAAPVLPGTPAIVLHHPQGDLKKLSRGMSLGYESFNGQGNYIAMSYSSGSTEAGSSGAPLLTCDGACTEYQVRGALYGGNAFCGSQGDTDDFSRLDLAYPYVARYLEPGAAFPSGDNVALEYYNVDLDHYFVTADAFEQESVDTGGAGPGWYRTGYSFPAFAAGSTAPGVAQVCRFYGSMSPGPNSHFYTLDPGECQFLQMLQAIQPPTQPRWNYEGIGFANYPPTNGSCPAGTAPVYRYYNNGYPTKDSNHRFATDPGVQPFMFSQGWAFEGVVMCVPD
jgi:hypothetical protein